VYLNFCYGRLLKGLGLRTCGLGLGLEGSGLGLEGPGLGVGLEILALATSLTANNEEWLKVVCCQCSVFMRVAVIKSKQQKRGLYWRYPSVRLCVCLSLHKISFVYLSS